MPTENASTTGAGTPTEPVHVQGQADLTNIVETYDIVLADFYADWCGPCKMLEPIVENVAAQTETAVAKVDVDVNQQLAAAFGVQGVPTMVLFADGEQVETVVGVQDESQLRSLIERYSE